MGITLIRSLDWTVAWDAASASHVYKRGIDVAFDGASLVHVGRGYTGKADKTIDGSRLMAMPGFVDIHSHPCHEPAYKGIREEHGVRNMYMSSLFERSQAFDTSDTGLRAASAEVAYCELLRSGVTSVVDIGGAWDGWADLMAKSGLRSFLAPGFASARWKIEKDTDLGYAWDKAGGKNASTRRWPSLPDCRGIRRAAFPAWFRRCRSTPGRKNCFATVTPGQRSAACLSPCTLRKACPKCRR